MAVVRLNRRVDMAPHISPICLPPKDMSMQSLHGWAAGWGALQPGSRLRPKTLQVGQESECTAVSRLFAACRDLPVVFVFVHKTAIFI